MTEAEKALEGLRGFVDLAYYRPGDRMTQEEHDEALRLYDTVRNALIGAERGIVPPHITERLDGDVQP